MIVLSKIKLINKPNHRRDRRMSDLEDLRRCTTTKKRKDGLVTIECNLGLWSVDAYHEINAVCEALHYFRQYKSDGEYSSIIGGKGVIDNLTKHKE